MFSDREIIISLIVVVASTLNAFQIIRIKTFSVLEYISSHIVAIKMGKGNGMVRDGEKERTRPISQNGKMDCVEAAKLQEGVSIINKHNI